MLRILPWPEGRSGGIPGAGRAAVAGPGGPAGPAPRRLPAQPLVNLMTGSPVLVLGKATSEPLSVTTNSVML
ncbi:hypothetical protein GCM10018781_40910 [Kitasatospora indigofera]|uniref:Uncharacterized protein n=1 Tax=Kitasatospora indigofera TaxID=67307 RepID=A0A919FXJ8_9ACTN|nr:hypothetical protein GCM10018781_40910 [Kitasatospora indigofera]